MDLPLITVIIPVYNMELYLERCLDSVLNNTYRNLEVICVDDGSKDCSLEILRRYEAADPRVVVIAKENSGVSSARNAGLDRMTGEFVTFVDPDDFVHPRYIDVLLATQRLSGADVSIGSFTRTYDKSFPCTFSSLTVSKQDVQVYYYSDVGHVGQISTYVWSKLISKSIIGTTRFPVNISYGEDTLFLSSLWEGKYAIVIGSTHLPVYYYYQGRTDSLVHTGRDTGVLRFISLLADKSNNRDVELIYLEPAIRRGLYFRYYYIYIKRDIHISQKIGRILRRMIFRIILSKNLRLNFKLARTLFILSPSIDRQYRIYRDPSLKNEEQLQNTELMQ